MEGTLLRRVKVGPKMSSSASRFDIANGILEIILRANLPGGFSLPPERELAKSLFVGRSLLREALRILELQGVITVTPGRGGGIRVRRPSVDTIARDLAILFRWEHHDLSEIMKTRSLIEIACARELCRSATPARIRALRRSAARRASAGDTAPYARFHHLLVASTGNRFLLQTYRALCQALYVEITQAAPALNAEREACQRDHCEIIDAIEARDADAAEWHLTSHLVGSHLDMMLLVANHHSPAVPGMRSMEVPSLNKVAPKPDDSVLGSLN
jgi:GntR family transcriptional repressor for pyruvate dehydrogenase complex